VGEIELAIELQVAAHDAQNVFTGLQRHGMGMTRLVKKHPQEVNLGVGDIECELAVEPSSAPQCRVDRFCRQKTKNKKQKKTTQKTPIQ
jgi:hypothetical protein